MCEDEQWVDVSDLAPVAVEITTGRVSAAAATRFHGVCAHVHQLVQLIMRGSPEVTPVSLTVVLTDDLTAEVNRRQVACGEGQASVPVDRLGGAVVAKCLLSAGHRPATIICGDMLWCDDTDEVAVAQGCAVVAHEMAHYALHELRGRTPRGGLRDGWTRGEQAACEILSDALEEYRADLLANVLLGYMGQAEDSEGTAPLALHHAYGDVYTEQLRLVLDDEVYPGWRRRVEQYREHVASTEDVFEGLARSIWETFVLVAHASAVALVSGKGDPLDQYESHPGVRLYLRDAWRTVIQVAEQYPLVGLPKQLKELEECLLDEAVPVFMDVWRRLGLTFEPGPHGGTILTVGQPL